MTMRKVLRSLTTVFASLALTAGAIGLVASAGCCSRCKDGCKMNKEGCKPGCQKECCKKADAAKSPDAAKPAPGK